MTKFKDVLKFDSGADGFMFMIYVLAICAGLVLIFGIYFICTTFSFA
ncbi:MAG: hypothetical protein AB7S78_00290 [Candidatus Omnitrophota bacterium]